MAYQGKPNRYSVMPAPPATRILAKWDGTPIMQTQDRPPLGQTILEVMGADICNSEEVLRRLSQKGWAPDAKDPKMYVGYMLSSSKDKFEHVKSKGRGFYRSKKLAPTWQERLLEDAFDAPT